MQEQTIPFAELQQLLAKENVPTYLWPSETRPVDAFKAAVRELEGSEFLVLPETVEDPTTHQRKTDSRTLLVVGTAHDPGTPDELPVRMKVHFDPKWESVSFTGGSATMARTVSDAYDLFKTSYRAADIRNTIHNAIRASRAIVLKKSGGVYFVPRQNIAPLESLARVIEQLPGAEMVALPVIDREEERKTVLKRYEAATSGRIAEMMLMVNDLATSGDPIVPSVFKRFVDELDYLRTQKAEYEALLNTTMSKADIEMRVLEAGIQTLSGLVRSK